MKTYPNTSKPQQSGKNRWFFLMNIVIAITIFSAVVLLKDSASHYQPRSAFDSAYIAIAKQEVDPEILHHGIIHTEAARAHAYRSIIMQRNGTFIIGLLAAFAFAANSIYIFRITKRQKSSLTVTS